jgi:hypothetical protein
MKAKGNAPTTNATTISKKNPNILPSAGLGYMHDLQVRGHGAQRGDVHEQQDEYVVGFHFCHKNDVPPTWYVNGSAWRI